MGRFFDNVKVIPRFANNLFQLKLAEASGEVARFGINTTIGLAGLFDPADLWFGLRPSLPWSPAHGLAHHHSRGAPPQLARNLSGMLSISVAIAVVSTVLGSYAGSLLHRDTGPLIITGAGALFFLSLLKRQPL